MNRIQLVLAACALSLVYVVPTVALDADATGLEIVGWERVVLGVERQLWCAERIGFGTHGESEVPEVHGGSSIVVRLDHTCGDAVSAALASLHATGTYVVLDGRLAAVTRIVLPTQRDACLASLIVGGRRCGWCTWDGTIEGRCALAFVGDGGRADSGRFEVADGFVRCVSVDRFLV